MMDGVLTNGMMTGVLMNGMMTGVLLGTKVENKRVTLLQAHFHAHKEFVEFLDVPIHVE